MPPRRFDRGHAALIEAGADVGAATSRRRRPCTGRIRMPAKVALLLSKGAAVDARPSRAARRCMSGATLAAGTPSMQLLLEAGANPQRRTLVGATPLFPAVNSSAEMTKLLLDKGADPNRRDEVRRDADPLHARCCRRRTPDRSRRRRAGAFEDWRDRIDGRGHARRRRGGEDPDRERGRRQCQGSSRLYRADVRCALRRRCRGARASAARARRRRARRR